ncbi:MAG TPA: GNAT family N-acetyltransferase [Fimbriimonadaceae bacterium]|nr:GNAT family N-acetyltransferase [Fimbriimonadaceae bacterium]
MSEFSIRRAEAADAERLIELMGELARFEKLDHLFAGTAGDLRKWLFGDSPVAFAEVAESGGVIVGYSVSFRSFSTFLGKPGLWLEDLYVTPAERGQGIGKALLRSLAAEAVRLGHGRLEWSVLDWNQDAIGFYEGLGAEIMADWRVCRLAGDRLARFGGSLPDEGNVR